jgi:hypothetical protein
MGVGSYFNLNRGAGRAAADAPASLKKPGAGKLRERDRPGMPAWEQVTMYLGVVVGVLGSTAVQQFKADGVIAFNVNIGMLATAALVGLVVIPLVFEKLKVDPTAPFIVRLGLFVQNGVFWQVVMAGIAKVM